jgi:sugar/nucleoside kinase (ribokinase family)
MNTYLGVSALLEPDDVVAAEVERASFLFCEGYLWDVDSAKAAIRKAREVARSSGRKVAFTASDAFCVDRHHGEFLDLVQGPVDVLFANSAELTRLYECELDDAVQRAAKDVELSFVTCGPDGSLVVSGDQVIEVPPIDVDVVDTTGAGDQYAAGALFGLARGLPLAEAGRLGTVAASEVISHIGPRPEQPLRDLL